MTVYWIQGRTSGKVYTIEIDDKGDNGGFIGHFYGDSEEIEKIDGVYMVDDESIDAAREFVEVTEQIKRR